MSSNQKRKLDNKNLVSKIDSKKIAVALKRARGQLEALIRFLENNNYDPEQFLIQMSAAASAINSAKVKMVEEYTKAKILSSIDEISKWI